MGFIAGEYSVKHSQEQVDGGAGAVKSLVLPISDASLPANSSNTLNPTAEHDLRHSAPARYRAMMFDVWFAR